MRAQPNGDDSWVKYWLYDSMWHRGRLPWWLRGLIVLAAGWGVLLCVQQIVDGYETTMEYRAAPLCQGGEEHQGEGCVRRSAGTVLDRRMYLKCTSHGTSGGGANGADAGGTTCTRSYELQVQRPGGATWLDVGDETFDDARKGDRTEVRQWQGDVVELRVRGHVEPYATASQWTVSSRLVLGFLSLACGIWAVLGGRFSSRLGIPAVGLLFVAVGISMLGSLAMFGGHPVVWLLTAVWTGGSVFWTAQMWRERW
ncbi:hypothetical protein [Streptomyces sp. NPDC049916]|uniref:hypothetical protein n=1 Tax=Streptomyces sp. NPDC049916 TaxID=3155156 RepID=UPI00343F2A17